ncbi:Hypothetical predicted protein [Cloeon dipterum]|uniref:Dipeptidase n=2 Tax=Cloeon dipterum TaxID=197152 RepID=A0A8S1CQP7_9INSE|nr:Hypothetical predicted protein [Cloeon dipterum]
MNSGFPRAANTRLPHQDIELNLDLIETIRADTSNCSSPVRTTIFEGSWIYQQNSRDHLTPPTTPSPDDFLPHPIKINGIGHCALHTPLPPPPKPPLKGIPEKPSFLHLQQGRQKLIVGSIIFVCLALFLGVGLPFALDLRASRLLEARLQVVQRILSDAPLVDGHNDLAWNLRRRRQNKLFDFKFNSDLKGDPSWTGGTLWSQTDLNRMQKGLVSAQFWSAYVPCGSQYLDSVQLTLEQIDVIIRLVEKYPKHLQMATTAEEIESAHRAGKIASLIGVEGGHSLGSSLAILRTLYQLGVRYLTLTHACNTPWADSSMVDEATLGHKSSDQDEDEPPLMPLSDHDGLSDFGKLVIQEMNRLGMMVDLSHVSARTMDAAIKVTKAPVIFSHSGAQAICNSTRNVPDSILSKLALNGGIVMVSFFNQFLNCKEKATLKDVIAHINHIRNMAGVNHVGLGAGFDGITQVPEGLEDVSKYPMLLAELARDRRWSAEDIKKLAGGNLVRVMRETARIRGDMERAKIAPHEEWISMEDLDEKTYCRFPGI